MAVPKRKTSKSRRDKRRTHYKAKMPTISTCSHCQEIVRPHHICPKCGHYKGKEILEIKA